MNAIEKTLSVPHPLQEEGNTAPTGPPQGRARVGQEAGEWGGRGGERLLQFEGKGISSAG